MYSIDTTKYINKMKSFCASQGVFINLENPKTIQDKLAWLNIYDQDELKTKCSDKILLHDYCLETIGEDLCIPIIGVWNNAHEIDWNILPKQFVLKCNHGSGMNIIVKDKDKIDRGKVENQLNKWMTIDFSMQNGFEAHYHDIKHKIFAEEYKSNNEMGLYDYKFWCFNGKPLLWTINDGNGHGDIMYYDMNDKEMNLYKIKKHNDYVKPENLPQMKGIAKKLSSNFKFVRVDLYSVDDRIYLGEMTFTPGAIGFKYRNQEDNIKIGDLLTL